MALQHITAAPPYSADDRELTLDKFLALLLMIKPLVIKRYNWASDSVLKYYVQPNQV